MMENNNRADAGVADRQKHYLLVVGTDTEELFCTSLLLQRFTYPVCTAQTAKQALAMVAVARPSLVITDLMLPEMSGRELARQFGVDLRDIPVIVLLPAGEEAIGEGLYLAKPVQAEDLFRAVQAAIEPTPRSNIRIPIRLPVFVNKVKLDGLKGECATYLSEHGLYIRTLKPNRRDEQIAIELIISGRSLAAEAAVLYNHLPGDGPFQEPGMAVKFIRISREDQLFLRQYIHDTVMQGIVSKKG